VIAGNTIIYRQTFSSSKTTNSRDVLKVSHEEFTFMIPSQGV
jgi:hypothetical protein